MSILNKVCIVTGASSGIGSNIAILFAKEGASVLLCGRDESRLSEVFKLCVNASGEKRERFASIIADVNNPDDRKRICQMAVNSLGKIDVLVHCAGILCPPINFSQETAERYDAMMNTNVKSAFFLIQDAEPELEKTKGSVVLISSIASRILHADNVVYHLSKGALDCLCKCLALGLGPKGIRINTVNPTFTKTRLFRDFGESPDNCAAVADMIEQKMREFHPLHGRCGTPEDTAQAVLFLASDASNYIIGQSLGVDGGVRVHVNGYTLKATSLQIVDGSVVALTAEEFARRGSYPRAHAPFFNTNARIVYRLIHSAGKMKTYKFTIEDYVLTEFVHHAVAVDWLVDTRPWIKIHETTSIDLTPNDPQKLTEAILNGASIRVSLETNSHPGQVFLQTDSVQTHFVTNKIVAQSIKNVVTEIFPKGKELFIPIKVSQQSFLIDANGSVTTHTKRLATRVTQSEDLSTSFNISWFSYF